MASHGGTLCKAKGAGEMVSTENRGSIVAQNANRERLTARTVDTRKVETIDNVHAAGLGGGFVDLVLHALVLGAPLGLFVGSLAAEGVGKLAGHGVGGLGRKLGRRRKVRVFEWTLGRDHGWRFRVRQRLEAGVVRVGIVGWMMGVSREAR